MKIYPKRPHPYKEDVKNGTIYLYMDVDCTKCGHTMSLANSGSADNGKCTRCGGDTR